MPLSCGGADVRPGGNVRYVCPQRIALPGQEAEIRLFFRVGRPDANVRIRVGVNGREIRNLKAARVNPGELQRVAVRSSELAEGSLVIDVVKEA
jgi:hypothetical protein